MNHIWTILCQKSSIDRDTNLLSIFNCVEELDLMIDKNNVPAGNLVIPAEFQLISFWTVENPKKDNILEITGELIDPTGKSLNKFENKLDIKKGTLRYRNITNIQGMPITEDGRYIFKIMQKKEGKNNFEVVSEVPLDIKISYKLFDRPQENKKNN